MSTRALLLLSLVALSACPPGPVEGTGGGSASGGGGGSVGGGSAAGGGSALGGGTGGGLSGSDGGMDGGSCEAGYVFDGASCVDVDECQAGSAMCSQGSTCVNTPGSYRCDCGAGYVDDGADCVDVDECATGAAKCDAQATCSNSVGSFSCTCKAGYAGDGVTCVDVDECASGAAGCAPDAVCTNTAGSFSCACKPGFSGDGATCADIDECYAGTAICGLNATCSNTPGSYRCLCAPGYSGDGVTCTDVDECASGSACPALATCTNTVGSYTCSCPSGYALSAGACVDLNECQNGTATCAANASCTNTQGSYTCTCGAGYAGDGKTCSDVDECAAHTATCSANASCTNTQGSYTCTCGPGFTGDGKTCTDVDECALHTATCSANANCTNTQGSYSCACKAGFTGNGTVCSDIDECSSGAATCAAQATCANTVGSYTCTCNSGYTGDGHTCTCAPESDTALCTAHPTACGTLALVDHCGTSRTVTCQPCTPVVSVTSPVAGAQLSGTTSFTATATSPGGVTLVDFLVDGAVVASSSTGPTFTASWNSALVANGTHSVVARAKDAGGALGSSSAVSFTVRNGVLGASISVHLTLGIPDVTDFVGYPLDTTRYAMIHKGATTLKHEYASSYNSVLKIANWTSWQLDSRWRGGQSRRDTFRADDTLPVVFQPGPVLADYTEPIYDRGHMCPSADRNLDVEDNDSTFYLTNMVPQSANNNQGPWQKLESDLQSQADLGKEIYIVSGPHMVAPISRTPSAAGNGVAIPYDTFKVAVVLDTLDAGVAQVTTSTRVIGVLMPNDDARISKSDPWTKWCATPRQIEQLTGLNFNADVPQAIQDVIETKCDPACDTSSTSYLTYCK